MLKPYLRASLLALLGLAAAPHVAHAQTGAVGIGTTAPDASAALDIVSSSKGLLLPRVAAASAIASPAPGLLVYQTGGTPGFYYNSGTAANAAWLRLSPADNLGNHTATQNLDLAGYQLVSGGSTGLALTSTGNLGLGTTAAQPATQKLDVRGNVRLGTNGTGTGTGQTIEWVGPGLNTDPVGIYRVNPAFDQSELRVVVGDVADANDKFAVGRMAGTSAEGGIPTGTFTPTFSVSSTGQVQVPGLAGTGTRVVTADANGNLTTQSAASGAGDNLGNHTATQALNLGTNALVGNGGNTGLTITNAGSARLPATSAYTYAAPKAYSATYGISDMQLEEEDGVTVRQRTTLNGGEYTYATRNGAANGAALRIPLHLPNGATITGITFYGVDNDPNSDLICFFISVLPSDNGGISSPSYSDSANSSGTPGYSVLTITPGGSRVIDNNRAYYVLINTSANGCTIGAVRVNYTVTQAE